MKQEKKNRDPISLDKNIVFKENKKKTNKKNKKIPKIYVFGGIGLILIIIILFINPKNSVYIDSPPPEEQAERDSIYNTILQIQQYQRLYNAFPESTDISIPAGLSFEVEDEFSWVLESDAGLYYSSGMDPDSFKRGEI